MTKEIAALMSLQGDIRILLMEAGLDDMRSLAVSGEVLHRLATSDLVTPAVREAYNSLATPRTERHTRTPEGR